MIKQVINNDCGKVCGEVHLNRSETAGKERISIVVHIWCELFTKLSTWFCTRFSRCLSTNPPSLLLQLLYLIYISDSNK